MEYFHTTRKKQGVGALSFACFSFLLIFIPGCGTLHKSVINSEETIRLTSDPSNAMVKAKNGEGCLTPCILKLNKVEEQYLKATLLHHETEIEYLYTRISYPVLFNLIFGIYSAAIGIPIDWLTDSLWTYGRDEIHFEFTESESEENIPPEPPASKADAMPLKAVEVDPIIKQRIAESDLERIILQYYGTVPSQEKENIRERLYHHLKTMFFEGVELNLDEAVRRAKFEEIQQKRLK